MLDFSGVLVYTSLVNRKNTMTTREFSKSILLSPKTITADTITAFTGGDKAKTKEVLLGMTSFLSNCGMYGFDLRANATYFMQRFIDHFVFNMSPEVDDMLKLCVDVANFYNRVRYIPTRKTGEYFPVVIDLDSDEGEIEERIDELVLAYIESNKARRGYVINLDGKNEPEEGLIKVLTVVKKIVGSYNIPQVMASGIQIMSDYYIEKIKKGDCDIYRTAIDIEEILACLAI